MGGGVLKGRPEGHPLHGVGISEHECRGLMDAVQGFVFVVDASFRVKLLNRPPFGAQNEVFVGRPITDVVVPEHRYFLEDALKQVMHGSLEARVQVQDVRDRRWYEVRVVAVANNGDRTCVLHALSIEEAKQLELERMRLRSSVRESRARRRPRSYQEDVERRLGLLADSLSVLISYIDRQHRYRYYNAAYERWLGLERERIIGKGLRSVMGAPAYQRMRPYIEAVLSGHSVEFEHSLPHKYAGLRRVAVRFVPDVASDGQIPGFYTIIQDLTQRREAEAAQRRREMALRELQKMEALGRLASGIAHEFRNVLQTVVTGCTVIQKSAEPASPVVRQAALIERSARRAESLTQQLLSFSQGTGTTPTPMDLHGLLSDLAQLLERLLGQGVHLELDLKAHEPVLAEPGQIQQVLLNLALNARDAMPSGGTLKLTTARVFITPQESGRRGAMKPGTYTLITISDTGLGMDEHTRRHAFDPFFTTKAQGKGTGLGLSTVYGIVQRLSGHIELDSAPGCGTTFRLYFPLAEECQREDLH